MLLGMGFILQLLKCVITYLPVEAKRRWFRCPFAGPLSTATLSKLVLTVFIFCQLAINYIHFFFPDETGVSRGGAMTCLVWSCSWRHSSTSMPAWKNWAQVSRARLYGVGSIQNLWAAGVAVRWSSVQG